MLESDDAVLQSLTELLEFLQDRGKILDLEIDSEAMIIPNEHLVSTFTFKVPGGLTITKYNQIIAWMAKHYPIISVKRVFHKHKIVLYYSYESSKH